MEELSEVWFSGYHRRSVTHSSRQLKTAIAITVLIGCGVLMVVVGATTDSLNMKTGGYTMCTLGLIAAICLFWWRYFNRKASASQRTMQRHESSLTQSVEFIELILRERQNNSSDTQTNNLTSSRREINFVLTRMIGYPPSYEEVTTNDDINDAMTQAQCPPPPCYTDEDMVTDTIPAPPSYEFSVARGASNK